MHPCRLYVALPFALLLLVAAPALGLDAEPRLRLAEGEGGCTMHEASSSERYEDATRFEVTSRRTTSSTCSESARTAEAGLRVEGAEVARVTVGSGSERRTTTEEERTHVEENGGCPDGACTTTTDHERTTTTREGSSWSGVRVATAAGDVEGHGASCRERERTTSESETVTGPGGDGGDGGGYAWRTREARGSCFTGATADPSIAGATGATAVGLGREGNLRCSGEPGSEVCSGSEERSLIARAEAGGHGPYDAASLLP